MTETTLTQITVDDVMAELATLADPKIRAVNEKHGDDHGVNLTKLRAVAKRLKRSRPSRASSGRPRTPPHDCSPC